MLQHEHEQTAKPHHIVHNTACKAIQPRMKKKTKPKQTKKKPHLLNPHVDINAMVKAIFNEKANL